MLKRTSKVDKIYIDTLSFASTLQLGDSCLVNGLSKALAVQREAEIYFGNEGNKGAYRVFNHPIPLPIIDETITYSHHHLNPIIKVNSVWIKGVSSSSLLHVGNSTQVSMEARVKHIRQLLPLSRKEEVQQDKA